VQLTVFGRVAGGWLFVEGLLEGREGAGQSAVDVEFVAGEELVEAEEEGLGSFRTQVGDGLVLLLGDFELLPGED
jgi:hypothetical protein